MTDGISLTSICMVSTIKIRTAVGLAEELACQIRRQSGSLYPIAYYKIAALTRMTFIFPLNTCRQFQKGTRASTTKQNWALWVALGKTGYYPAVTPVGGSGWRMSWGWQREPEGDLVAEACTLLLICPAINLDL